MTARGDVELGRIGLLALVALAAAVLFAVSCAHRRPDPPPLWDICRDACAARGGSHAAVVGSTDTNVKPGCLCAGPKDPGT